MSPPRHHRSSRRGRREDEPADRGEGSAGPERLQKVLAAAGVGSRRDCEELIRQGRVEVDRQVVTELGTRVDPLQHEIRVDGEALKRPKRLYFAVNKPSGVVTTNYDPSGRPRVVDLVPTEERVFAVGRLDRASEGLILVTNDGEFANRLTHPRYGVTKTYLVRVAGSPTTAELAKLRRGIHLAEGYCKVESLHVKGKHKGSTDMIIVLAEGRNREIRRILARVGHKALRLKRLAVGRLKLGDLPTGAWRRLMPAEINGLLAEAKERKRERRSNKLSPSPPLPLPHLQESEGESGRGGEWEILQGDVHDPPPIGDVIDYDEPRPARGSESGGRREKGQRGRRSIGKRPTGDQRRYGQGPRSQRGPGQNRPKKNRRKGRR